MFLPWIEAEFEMSETANNMMRVATVYGDKSQTVWDLNATALYELAAPSTPESVRTAAPANPTAFRNRFNAHNFVEIEYLGSSI